MLFAALSSLLLAGFGPAQEAERTSPGDARELSATERYYRLNNAYHEADQAWHRQCKRLIEDAREAGRETPALPPRPVAEHLQKFMEAAEDYAGREEAAQFLVFVASRGMVHGIDAGKEAVRELIAHHVHQPEMIGICSQLDELDDYLGEGSTGRVVTLLEQQSESEVVRSWAIFTRCRQVFASRPPESAAFQKAEQEVLDRLALDATELMRSRFEEEMRIRKAFGIGMVAPDIAGPDLDGVDFRLRDYAGKVVLLDFWGDW